MWSKLHLWSDFTRRAMYVNSHGRVEPDVLLVNPMESVWALLGQTDKLWWSPEAGHVGFMDNCIRHGHKRLMPSTVKRCGS